MLTARVPLHRLVPAPPQVRIHCTTDTDFYLRVRSTPIIEHSSRVRFAPFALATTATSEARPAAAGGDGEGSAPGGSTRDEQVQALLMQHKLAEETGLFSQVGAGLAGTHLAGHQGSFQLPRVLILV